MNNLSGKKAILYRRVSTTNQKTFGNSLNSQKNKLRHFCFNNGIKIKKEFEEDFSAKNFNRPIVKELIEYAHKNKNDIDFLLVTSWDRFSRNVFEAQTTIKSLSDIGIQVNSIDNWTDYDDYNHLLIHLIQLALPEVDNKMRSQKVKAGIRQALKEGRWVSSQPKGYIPGRDELGKPLMQPNPELSQLITELFNDFSKGLYSQNELLKLGKYKALKLTKSNLSRMLKQIAYAGKIKVPSFKNEPEQIVDALHKPLISMTTFNKVQYQLNKRSRYKQKPSKIKEELPLRGFLKCAKCGSNLTGSGSRSKTGTKHYYYHCNPRKGCDERFRVGIAHQELLNYFEQLNPSDEVCDLLELILIKKHEESINSVTNLVSEKEKIVLGLTKKNETLLEKLLEGVIDNNTYKDAKIKIDDNIATLKHELHELNNTSTDLKEFVQFGLFLFKNLKSLFKKTSVNLKQKLLSSILAEKLIFENNQYRTPKMSKGFEFIFNNISILKSIKEKNGRLSYDNLPLSTEGGT